MRILIVNSNFPGRLGALARHLAASGHEVLFAAAHGRRESALEGVRRAVLKIRARGRAAGGSGFLALWKRALLAGEQALAPLRLLAGEFLPDMVLATHAEGLSFFIRQAFPQAFHVFYLTGAEAHGASLYQLRALESDCCVAFSHAERRILPAELQNHVHLAAPWVETELLDPALAQPFLPETLPPGAELLSADMRGLDEAQEGAVYRLVAEVLALRPRCHAVLDYGESGGLRARCLPEGLRSRLHTAEFLPLAARRDMLCASSLHLCPNEAGLFPGRLEAMSCAALIMSPVLQEDAAVLRPGENMLPLPPDGRKLLAAVFHALDHAREFTPLRTRARETVLAAFTPQAVLPGHAAMLMEAYAARKEALAGNAAGQAVPR